MVGSFDSGSLKVIERVSEYVFLSSASFLSVGW